MEERFDRVRWQMTCVPSDCCGGKTKKSIFFGPKNEWNLSLLGPSSSYDILSGIFKEFTSPLSSLTHISYSPPLLSMNDDLPLHLSFRSLGSVILKRNEQISSSREREAE